MFTINDIKICVLGGDMRQIYAVRSMCKKGYNVNVFGLGEEVLSAKNADYLKYAVSNAKLILLPLPFSTDGIRINCPLSNTDIKLDELVSALSVGQIVAGGKFTDDFVKKITQKNCIPYDYYSSEKLTVLNAVPTAEGAISIAMNNLKTTIFGSKCAITGYGRIGRVLSKSLKSLGADVKVFSRSESSLAWAEVEGYTSLNISQMEKHVSDLNIIFNTVPDVVINRKVIDNMTSDAIIIDLASSPGGVELDYAKQKNRKVIFAHSLPGKVAPETAGNIISDTVLSKMSEVFQ